MSHRSLCRLPLFPCVLLATALPRAAQANADPLLDVRLSQMRVIEALGREGVFPNGLNGVAFETTVCNEGLVEIPWRQPMNVAHPKIAFLVASVRNGRIEQISDRSYLKHGFFALNGRGCNVDCINPGGTVGEALGIGCSDTYGTVNNGDAYYLGAPDEVDPWLGTWDKVCSVFDRGIPDVGAPDNCDGRRSLTHSMATALGPVGNRIRITDEDFILGGSFFFQGQYIVEGLPDAGRDNALATRGFTAQWSGSRWNLAITGALQPGSILERWPGATVTSGTNGNDDGRVFVGLVVSGPVDGFYRYEYALHNRDSARGVGALRIPLCAGARVRAAGFRDIDGQSATDWSATLAGNELVFASGGAHQPWNTLYNFWFESDAAPGDAAVTLEAGLPGPGAAAFLIGAQAPVELPNRFLGAGCALGTPPSLFATGTPARATLGNASFGVASTGNAPGEPSWLYLGLQGGSTTFRGCTIWIGPNLASFGFASLALSDASGRAVHPGPIPADPALEGLRMRLQTVARRPGGGLLLSNLELSDGLEVLVGSSTPSCP